MLQTGTGIAERIATLMETWGAAGMLLLIIVGVVGALFIVLRGAGFALLLLTASYSLFFVEVGGISTVAFFVRVLMLLLLAIAAFRGMAKPRWPFYAILGYAVLGILFSSISPVPLWSLQKSLLLLLTTAALMLGVGTYLRQWSNFRALYYMFALSGVIWVVASFPFLPDFMSGTTIRFSGGSEKAHSTGYAAFGGLMFPFLLWCVIQSRSWIWRFVGLFGVATVPIFLFLSGTRTAAGVGMIASLPLLFRGGLRGSIRGAFLIGGAAIILLIVGQSVIGGRDTEHLTDRLRTLDLTGREYLWSAALDIVMSNPVIGRGIGASDYLAETGAGLFHSAYLSIWCNTGLIGLGLVLAAMVSQAVGAFRLLPRATDPMAKDALRLSMGFLFAILAMGLTRNSFASPSTIEIALLLIMITSVTRARDLIEQEEACAAAVSEPLPDPGAYSQPFEAGAALPGAQQSM